MIADYPWQEIGDITLWQVIPGEEAEVVATISETDAWLTDLAFSPDGKTLAVGFNVGEIRLYRTSDGTRLLTIKAFHDFVMSLAYSRDGRYIIADSTSFDSNSYIFNAENGSKVATLSTESWEPGQVSFSPDGTLAAATASDGTHIFTTSNWQATGVVIGGVWNGTFTCDSQGFMEGMGDQVSLYSLTSGQKIDTIEIPEPGSLYCLADGRMVILDWFVRSNLVQVKLAEP
jgi:WD40 repeat protein